MATSKNPVPEKHLLFCSRCYSIRERIIGLPQNTRSLSLTAPDYQHFVKRMCLGDPFYAGIALERQDEAR
jgi:hypothetical protein